MTPQRDIERVLERWLDDGINAMPDRVYLSILDRVERQPQQRAWRLSWRDSHVNTYIKPLVAVAAVVVIAVAGIAILGRPSGSDVGGAASPAVSSAPSPSASPSPPPATQSASPSASAAYPAWFTGDRTGAGILPSGSRATTSFVPAFTFTVPEGWVNSSDEIAVFGLFPDSPANAAEYAASGSLAHEIGLLRYGSPYWYCDAWEDHPGTTVAETVSSLVATEAIDTSEPVDVTIGGLTGKQVDIRLDPDWTETCPGDPPTFDLGDTRFRLILLDTPDRGAMFINVGSLHSADHEAFLAEAMPIVESFQFDLDS
jgi:hypothetical protein